MIDALIGGIATGSLYAMLAVGFVVVYAATGVANFSQGALAMVASFMMFTAARHWGFPVAFAALLGLSSSVAVSWLVYVLGLRLIETSHHLYKGIATLAIDIILINSARVIWGPSSFQFDSVVRGSVVTVGGMSLPMVYVITFVAALGSALLLHLFLSKTRMGIAVRAVAQNSDAALLMGVRLPIVSALSWVICGLMAGLAGLLLTSVTYLSYNMMDPYLVRMFAAAALGGLTSVLGAVVGGIGLGAIEGVIGRYIPATLIDVVSVLVLLCVLMFRPQGLFGTARVRRV